MRYTNAEITERRKADLPDASDVQTWRAYAAGDHREVLTTDQHRLLEQRSSHTMVDNVLNLILKTTASRLRLTEWTVTGDPVRNIRTGAAIPEGEAIRVNDWLAATWLMNRLPRLQFEVHYAAVRDAQSVVSMAWRNGRVHLWRESWWDGASGVYIAYDDAGEYEFAVKEWTQRNMDGSEVVRRTVYEPGRITRWKQAGDGWEEYTADREPAVIELNRRDGEPMPIPLVHFPNGDGVSESVYGQSMVPELLALQDDLNATQLDISAASMLTAFQRLFISGLGEQTRVALAPGSVFGVPGKDARLQVVEAGDLGPLIETHHFKRDAMSVNSRTPVHTLTGDWPSGAALLRAEMPLIEKIEGIAAVTGPQWTMVAHRAMELANALGGLSLSEDVPITSVFAPAERIDELTEMEVKQARADYWETISRLPREAMVQAGVDETVADQILAERDAAFAVVGDMATDEEAL